jgi:cytochrome c-type biogenesis protein
MAGVSVEDFRGEGAKAEDRRTRTALIGASVAFVLGFSTVFVALGAGASTIGGLLRAWQQELAVVAGLLIILMGLNFLGVIRIPFLSRAASRRAGSPPISWGSPSPSAGRRASARCSGRS